MLTIDQIEPGIVAWLDSDALNADPRVSATGVIGVRPFVCIDVGPGTTTWLALTTRDRAHHDPAHRRLPVRPVDKFNGTPMWRARTNYIRDMAFPVVARDVAILDACVDSYVGHPSRRARVSSALLRNLRQRIYGNVAQSS